MKDVATWAVSLWQHLDEILQVVGAVVLAATAIVHSLRALVNILGQLALKTQTKRDDEALSVASKFLSSVVLGLDWFYKVIRPLSVRGTGDKVKEKVSKEAAIVKTLSKHPPAIEKEIPPEVVVTEKESASQ